MAMEKLTTSQKLDINLTKSVDNQYHVTHACHLTKFSYIVLTIVDIFSGEKKLHKLFAGADERDIELCPYFFVAITSL
jgi:hypothetical protein